MQRVQSSPAIIAAACNLRQFSLHRRFVSTEAENTSEPATNMVELLIDLKGGNGRWKQIRAKEQYALEMKLKEEAERKARLQEARKRNQQALEAAKQKKLQEEEMRRNQERAERERLQREAELAILKAKREEEEHSKRCHEQLVLLKQPRPCGVCKGSGKCTQCKGKGFFEAMYLSSSTGTGRKHDQFHGRTRRGCAECGGYKKDEDEGTVFTPLTQCNNPISGSGFCPTCDGSGKTKLSHADIVGADLSWFEDIQSLMRQMRHTELGLLLADKIWVVRLVAAEVLQEQGKTASNVHKLAPLLKDKHWKVQVAAVLSLGSGGASAAPYVPDISELFKDKREEVRKAAVKSLASCVVVLPKSQQESAVAELNHLQWDKNEEIGAIARNALQRVKESKEEK